MEVRGKLYLKDVPEGEIEQKLVAFLLNLLKTVSPDQLTQKVRKTPFVLSRDISAEKGRKLMDALQKLGASAAFVPHVSVEPSADRVRPGESTEIPAHSTTSAPKNMPLPTRPKLQKNRTKQPIIILITILFVFSLSFFIWQNYSLLTAKFFNPKKAQQKTIRTVQNSAAYHSLYERAPSVMRVAPQDMYHTFLRQYQLHPDTRFLKAFEIITERFWEFHNKDKQQSAYNIGHVVSNRNELVIPLQKKNRTIAEIKLQLPMTFPNAMSALNECLEIMEEGTELPKHPFLSEDELIELNKAHGSIHMADPRSIIASLIHIETLWQKAGPQPQILQTTVRAYAMLLLVLFPDRMDYTDDLAAHALAYLAVAKRMDPDLTLTSEEALLSMVMDYTSHAQNLLKNNSSSLNDLADKIIEAYVKQDLQTLKDLNAKTPKVIGMYLLARLYREMKLYSEAEKVAANLLSWYPTLYPIIVETIYSGKLSTAKNLTILYPMYLLAQLESQITPASLDDKRIWQERLKGLYGEQSTANISMSQFDILLDKWVAGSDLRRGLLVDEKRIKIIFRTLYTGALFLRFNMLMDRWGVIEMAENYIQLLATEDKNHPMVMEMLAEVNAELGKRQEADNICSRLINHPKVSGRIVFSAIFKVDDLLTQIKLTPAAANKLDGRPEYLFFKGRILQQRFGYDLAQKYYTLGLARNPYFYKGYNFLSHVTRSDEPLMSAIKKYPFSFTLLEEAGDHFAKGHDKASKERALACYDKARKLVPTRRSLPRKKAAVLRQMSRHREAVKILKSWLEQNDTKDLTMVYYRTTLANTYLKMKKPNLALKVIGDQIGSYQAAAMMVGARTYEEIGDLAKSEEILLRAVKRYPTVDHVLCGTAAFLWRQNRSEEASKYIAQGRKSMGKFSRWYFKDFLEVFSQAPENNILKAVDSLIKQGASKSEITSLGYRLHQIQRPEVGFKIIQKAPARLTMERLEQIVDLYKVMRDWKGRKQALDYLNKAVPSNMRLQLAMVLYKKGLFDVILTELDESVAIKPAYKEFLWLQRLIAWLALEKNPAGLEKEFIAHYKQGWTNKIKSKISGKNSYKYYNAIGRYLLEMISRNKLLTQIKTPKQRCEFAYYIGLRERLKSNFPEAAHWYQLCRETLLRNNGEFHWASDELFWWAHMGTKNRHRLPGDDIKAYHAKQLQETGS
jgi:tetratricopeptide (TPR) repeat protein